jgi:hypothetical protein
MRGYFVTCSLKEAIIFARDTHLNEEALAEQEKKKVQVMYSLLLQKFDKSLNEELYHAHNKPLHVLLDMTNFTGNYCLEALSLFTGFAKTNKSFIERTASFGGSDKVKMAGEIVITLSGRDNIKIFNTKEEALNWLK